MRFLLDTDAVSSVAEGIGTISSNVASISCSKYNINVDSDDGLDFSSAKNTLVANISACADRIKASQTIINGIIDSHSSLQKSLTFENYLNPPKEETKEEKSNSPFVHASSPARTSSSLADRVRNTADNALITTETTTLITDTEKEIEERQLNIPRKASIKKVSYANVDYNKITSETKKVMNKCTKNDKSGYFKVNDRYVIACPPTVGQVGDVLRFTSKEGKVVECVVGVNTVTDANSENLYLLVNSEKSVKAVDFGDMLTNKETTIKTIGTYTDTDLENQTNIYNVPTMNNSPTQELKTAENTQVTESTGTTETTVENSDSNNGGVVNA